MAILKVLALAGDTDDGLAQQAFREGAAKIGLTPESAEQEWAKPAAQPLLIVHSLTRLSSLVPMDKKTFFEALWQTAHYDKKLDFHESLYLRAISEALEIPMPASLS